MDIGQPSSGSPVPPRRSVRLLPSLALAVLSLTVSLLALEGAARLYAARTYQGRGMTFDAELGWRPLPNVKKIGTVWGMTRPATTNAQGWRDREHNYERAAGIRRVVAIGDSFTFGVEVDDGERFTDLLPQRIERLEVVNLGVAGYGTGQELRLLETEGVRYRPDVVILTICVNNDFDDIAHERIYSWPKPSYSLDGGELQLRKPSISTDIRLRESSYLFEFLYQRVLTAYDKPRLSAGFEDGDAGPLFDALLRRFEAVTRDHGARLVAVLAYGPERLGDVTEVSRHITEVLERDGIPTLDTRRLLATRSPDPNHLLYSEGGVHWNAEGHAIIAEGVQQLLTRVGIE